ncbi:gp53-like domain-containing protein [Proteus mirabilis]|uniref:gp53-like domain-containing protein n=1 Tax=Proteus mirabilis TaxID=584 RepID=UPI0021AB8F2C|nr:hypothetical protein [Proteus mirabilis]
MTTIFKTPFATQGDKASIPVEIQSDGSVSYTQGYGYDYERDQVTDPAAKDIEREKMNGIFHDITEAIGEIQRFGFPKWDEAGKPYAIRTIVYHKNKVWQSKVENNNIEPVAGNAWAELKADATASDVGAYSKGESDKRFQPLGNYTPSGYSYSKAETDTKYQPKGNYAPAGNYANKGDSYTKTESDGRYQAKGSYQPSGNYALAGASYIKAESDGRYQPKGNYADRSSSETQSFSSPIIALKEVMSRNGNISLGIKTVDKPEVVFNFGTIWRSLSFQDKDGTFALVGDSYTRIESDGRYQAKGSYATAGSSYTKAESDGRYQGKGNYQPAGNYALVGASYTKAESDGKYQPKGSYQTSGYSYSKSESDSKYQPKGNYGAKNTANKAQSGWWKCGDTGLIYQWGVVTGCTTRTDSRAFPIPFPNKCLSVSGSYVSEDDFGQGISIKIKSNKDMLIISHGASGEWKNTKVQYIAIGY